MVSKYQSPGVYPIERDLSASVPSASTSRAAIVGYSPKGSKSINLITSQSAFVAEYGEPSAANFFHYSALAYLEQGNALYCLRVTGDNALYSGANIVADTEAAHNAHDEGQSTPIYYDDSGHLNQLVSVFAKDPGVWGDLLSFTITDVISNPATHDLTDHYTFRINVWLTDAEGNSQKVESWVVSRKTKLDGFGAQLYCETRINDYSSYIVVADNTALADTVMPLASTTDTITDATGLAGGSDGDDVNSADVNPFVGSAALSTGWYAFQSTDEIDIQILIDAGYTRSTSAADVALIHGAMTTVAIQRKDCIAVLSAPLEEDSTATELIAYRTTALPSSAQNTSYSALYAPAVKINDSFNDQIISVPVAGYIAASMAFTDYTTAVWYPPAGYDRGTLNVLGADVIFTPGDRDLLYANQINPIQVFRGYGTVIWGQKTLQRKFSALSSINIRRTISVMEKSIVMLLRSFVFELNNTLTRFVVTSVIQEYLETLKSGGAFQTSSTESGYFVMCNETNNTPAIIDANEMHVDVFVKPVHAAEYIQLQTIITKSGVSFEELISRGTLI